MGPNALTDSDLNALDLSLQQLLFDRSAGIEVAFNRQQWTESSQSLFAAGSPYISIDVNEVMWTGEANPNFGRPFISTAGTMGYTDQEIETARAKVFYELDLEEKISGRLGRFLGRHVFSVLGQREVYTTRSHNGGRMFYTPDQWPNGNNQSRTSFTGKLPTVWVYLGPSLANVDNPAGVNLSGLQQSLLNFHETIGAQDVILTRTPPPNAAAASLPAHNPYYTTVNLLKDLASMPRSSTTARATRWSMTRPSI